MIKFLVIRRDNIGDLVCTTPLLATLREQYPQAQIDVFVNDYNVAVVKNNPAVNKLYTYTKTKHRTNSNLLKFYWKRLKTMWQLRRQKYDYVIIGYCQFCKFSYRFAKWINPLQIVGFNMPKTKKTKLNKTKPQADWHEVQKTYDVLTLFNLKNNPPPLKVYPNFSLVEQLRKKIPKYKLNVAIQISARKPRQRWPAEFYKEFIEKVSKNIDCHFFLFWSPGKLTHAAHPGDDEKALELLTMCDKLPLTPIATSTLDELIAAFFICDIVVTSDGGALHIATALQKPLLCFYAGDHYINWYPWKTNYYLLNGNEHVKNISPQTAVEAFLELAHNKEPTFSKILQSH